MLGGRKECARPRLDMRPWRLIWLPEYMRWLGRGHGRPLSVRFEVRCECLVEEQWPILPPASYATGLRAPEGCLLLCSTSCRKCLRCKWRLDSAQQRCDLDPRAIDRVQEMKRRAEKRLNCCGFSSFRRRWRRRKGWRCCFPAGFHATGQCCTERFLICGHASTNPRLEHGQAAQSRPVRNPALDHHVISRHGG